MSMQGGSGASSGIHVWVDETNEPETRLLKKLAWAKALAKIVDHDCPGFALSA